MKPVSTSIVIAASKNRIWNILTDFDAYGEWNPFMPMVTGVPKVGERLSVRLQPPGGKAMSFRPVVLVTKPAQEFRWRGRLILPGLFDGEHYFQLSAAPGGTLLKQGENFSGLIVQLLPAATLEQTRRGFIAMNEALKARAEA